MTEKKKRVILKLSGEALGENGRLFNHKAFESVARTLIAAQESGVELAVVIGGGNVWRGRRGAAMCMGAVAADQMGMLATLQNCLYMRDTLVRLGARATVMSAVDILRFAEAYNTARADELLAGGHIVLLACGTGNPFFSTDSAVVLRALELNCDEILMAKNVDGVYSTDPTCDPNAELIREATYDDCVSRDLRAMDAGAFVMLRDNRFPLVRVFALEPADNVLKVLSGDPMGTVLHP
ncbi:MAG: uridine monophosphate kinase [Eubacteriales bacterium]|nr:uridine monophosphate kinase [Eubacteriales bacterium]